jgi:hypothetical protein
VTVVDLADAVAALTYRRWLEDRPAALPCACPAAARPHVRASPCTFHRVAPEVTARVASGERGTVTDVRIGERQTVLPQSSSPLLTRRSVLAQKYRFRLNRLWRGGTARQKVYGRSQLSTDHAPGRLSAMPPLDQWADRVATSASLSPARATREIGTSPEGGRSRDVRTRLRMQAPLPIALNRTLDGCPCRPKVGARRVTGRSAQQLIHGRDGAALFERTTV